MGYQIAGRVNPKQDLTKVPGESNFARSIRQIFKDHRPRRVIETGTYHGNGTTAIIAAAVAESCDEDAAFFSIEVNPRFYQRAVQNLARQNLSVALLNGLSVPRRLLPSIAQIEQQYVHEVEDDGIFVDHEEADRAARYYSETDFPTPTTTCWASV